MKRRPSGERLFTVGLVADTHCNEREDFSASPYPANAEANPRARYVMACLEREVPDFVVHLGDMVNPVPELPTYDRSVAEFKKIAALLSMPLRFVPGNHVINAALINSGLAQESKQRHWLESEFESAPDIRTFVFTHYPPFVSDPDEPSSYDNLEEPGRS